MGAKEQNKMTGFQIQPPHGQAMVEGHGHHFRSPSTSRGWKQRLETRIRRIKKTALQQS
jgi:hypothetical protein